MSVTVQGPDGNNYEFPDGTDKAKTVAYFKKKGITGKSSAPAPSPSGPAPKLGTFGDTASNIWQHAKGLVTGPVKAIGTPAQTPEEGYISGQFGPAGLGVYRMFVEPTVQGIGTAIDQARQGNYLSKDEYDAQGNYRPSMISALADAIPLAGPWARGVETEAQQKGMLPALAGFGTDIVGSELMSRVPEETATFARNWRRQGFTPAAAKLPFVGRVARRGAQTLLGAGPDLTRRAVEGENVRTRTLEEANEDLKKEFLDKLDASMTEDREGLAEHERKVAEVEAKNRDAQTEHQEKLRALHDRNIEQVKQRARDLQDLHNRNAEKTGEYRSKVQAVKDENAATVSEHKAAREKAQQDLEALQKAHEQGLQHQEQLTDLQKQVKGEIKALEKKVFQEANNKYIALGEKMEGASFPREEAAEAVAKAYEEVRGSPDKIKQFKFIADMEKGKPTLNWNDYQGYLEEFRKFKSPDSDLRMAVQSMEDFIEKEMGKAAEEHGQGAEWTDAQASWAKMRQTFHKKSSPVAQAYRAETGPRAARPFLEPQVLEQHPAVANLRDYDPALAAKLERLRELHGKAKSAPGPPKPLATAEPPKLKDPEEVKPPKLEDPEELGELDLENPEDLPMPQHKGTAEAPPVKSPLTPRGKFEEHVVDVPELKKETARKAARRFSEAKEGDAYLLHTPAAPFVLAKKGLAARLDRPAVLDWLAQPSPGDLKALQDLPEEARELAQQRINEFLQKQPAPLRLDPRLKLFLRAGTIASEKYGSQPTGESTAAAAERQAREAAQRLSSTP